jgi:transcriptional regulator with XRE-family HTH domain
MLAATLTLLCRRMEEDHGISQNEVARRLRVAPATLSKVLNGRLPVHYNMLERFELLLGVPTGTILTISHVASLVRDTKQKDVIEKQLAIDRLQTISVYLGNLRDCIENRTESGATAKPKLLGRRGLDPADATSWPLVIGHLMDTTRGQHTKRNEPTPFTDAKRLAAMPLLNGGADKKSGQAGSEEMDIPRANKRPKKVQ